MMIMLNSFFFFIEKSTEESAARETFIGTGDPFRCIAVLITVKERTLSWMKKQSEACELCPKGRTWCLSLVWPVSFQFILSLFAGLDHAACLQRICFMDALEFCVNRQQCALVPQCCTGRQLNRQAPSQIVLLQETQCQQLLGEQQSAGVLLQDDTSWPFSVKEDEGQQMRKRQPEEEKRGPKWRNSSSHLLLWLQIQWFCLLCFRLESSYIPRSEHFILKTDPCLHSGSEQVGIGIMP